MNTTAILLMFGTMLVLLVLGINVVYAIGITALIFAFLLWGPTAVSGLITASISVMGNWTLLAIPLFTFMSIFLFQTGVVEDLYDASYRLTAKIRGGLCIVTVGVGALMGAMTGVVAGTVTALGIIALPQMLKYKYDKKISLGSILAGGTLGQLIPPSTNMIVYGTMTGVSVGGLFAAGISSGLLLSAIYIIYILIRSYKNKDLCPVMPEEDRMPFLETLKNLKKIVAPVLLVLMVLGSIFSGIATPTEAAAVGSTGAIIIALFRKKFTFKALFETTKETLRMTSMIGYITISAIFFGQVFTAIGGNVFIASLVDYIPFGKWGVIIVTMGILFVLGMFLDTTAIVVICAPIFAPLVAAAGFDSLWFGTIFQVCIQMAYLTPPFGFSLFYLKGVVPKGITLGDINMSALPFIGLQGIGLLLCIVFPPLAMWGVKVFM